MPAAVVQGNPNNSAVDDTVDVQHNERSAPAQIGPRVTQRAAMARRMHAQEVPGVHEAPMVFALGIAAARRTKELLLGLAHRPKAGKQFVHEKTLFHGHVPGLARYTVLSGYVLPPAKAPDP